MKKKPKQEGTKQSKGGKARAEVLSPSDRSDIASRASRARWAKARAVSEGELTRSYKGLPVAKYWGKLILGTVELPAYVLNDGRRVIGRTAATEMLTGIKGGGALEKYLGVSALKPFIDMELVLEGLVSFDLPEVEGLGKDVKGLPAELLIDICRGFVNALEASQRPNSPAKLTERQVEMAMQASMFLAACAKLGIVALIDEATGYQYDRPEDALQVKLAAYLSEEMRAWEKTFPDELWFEFARLTGWQGGVTKRPKYWGKLVMELVYGYLDKDVADWLKENAPAPRHGQNYHQWLSDQYGLKKLVEHMWKLIGISKTCANIGELRQKMAELHGRVPVQFTLYLPPMQDAIATSGASSEASEPDAPTSR